MVDRGIAQLVAEAFGLPSWAPKIAKNIALAVIVLTAVFMQPTFAQGVKIFADREAQQMMERMQPFIDALVSDTAPTPDNPGGSSG